ncbi:MAG: CynX/NimT family MFS transporter [Alphaproteobacteria bacterium]
MSAQDTRTGEPPSRTNWFAVSVVVLASVTAAFQIGKAPVALPVMQAELGLTLEEGVWIISIFNLLGIAFGMFAGATGDRLGHRKLLLSGFVAIAVASFLGAGADGFAMLLASRVLEGFGFVVVVAVAPALFLQFAEPRHHRLIFGFYGGYWPAGVAVMILVTPIILEAAGWRGLWSVNGVLAILVMLLVAYGTRSKDIIRPPAPPPPFGQALRTFTQAGPLVLALTFATYSSIHVTVVALLPTFYVEAEALGLGSVAPLTAFVTAVNVAGNVVGGTAIHRGVARWKLVIMTFALLGMSALLMYNDGLTFGVRLSAAIFLSFIAGIIPACLFATAAVVAPTAALVGATTGLMMQGSQLGQLLGPVAMAKVVTVTGTWDSASITLIIAAVTGSGLMLLLRWIETRRTS